MKHISIFLSCFLLSFTASAQQIPGFKEVVTKFFSTYNFESDETYPKFFRKKDGWYIAEEYYKTPGTFVNTTLFWSGKTKGYEQLSYPVSTISSTDAKEKLEAYLKTIDWNYLQYPFSRNKYYGYPGWDWDIINDTPEPVMTDTLYESLGRAYSNYAIGFLYNQTGDLFQNNDPDRVPLPDQVPISVTRREKFIEYELKAIDVYTTLYEKYPAYNTIVGNAQVKLANEHLAAYTSLMTVGDSLNARKFLTGTNYPDSLVELAKTYLKYTPKNGILITGGDNDTYPLLYLQEAQHYRKDVLVINSSLLGLRRYLNMLDKNSKGSLFSTKDSVYFRNNFDYFLFRDSKEHKPKMEASKFINDLNCIVKKDIENADDIVYRDEILKTYHAREIFFKPAPTAKTNGIAVAKTKSVKLRDYLFMNEFMMLDIINTNLYKRPVCFTYPENLFEDVLKQTGIIFKVKVTAD